MDKDAAATVADLILTSTQKGPETVIPDPSAAGYVQVAGAFGNQVTGDMLVTVAICPIPRLSHLMRHVGGTQPC